MRDIPGWILAIVTVCIATGGGLVAWGEVSTQVSEHTTAISLLGKDMSEIQGDLKEIRRCLADHSTCKP